MTKQKTKRKLDLKKLKIREIQYQFGKKTEESVNDMSGDINQEWTAIKSGLDKAAREVIGTEEKQSKKQWIPE